MAVTISVNGVTLATISDLQLQVIYYSESKSQALNNFKGEINNLIKNKIESSKNELQKDWLPIIKALGPTIPSQDADIATLIFSQPEYKDYDARHP